MIVKKTIKIAVAANLAGTAAFAMAQSPGADSAKGNMELKPSAAAISKMKASQERLKSGSVQNEKKAFVEEHGPSWLELKPKTKHKELGLDDKIKGNSIKSGLEKSK